MCVNSKTRVSNVSLQTKLTTDTVIPDNVLDLAVGGFQQESNIYLVKWNTTLIEKTQINKTKRIISLNWEFIHRYNGDQMWSVNNTSHFNENQYNTKGARNTRIKMKRIN